MFKKHLSNDNCREGPLHGPWYACGRSCGLPSQTTFKLPLLLFSAAASIMHRTLYTVGHGTRSTKELVSLLQEHMIDTVVDIRSIPRSSKNPQHNRDTLQDVLSRAGVTYTWMGDSLGGLRKKRPELNNINAGNVLVGIHAISKNQSDITITGWHNDSFHGYADWMQTDEFKKGIEMLEAISLDSTTAIMCSETVYFRCHRSMVADAMVVRGWKVQHIMNAGKLTTHHKMTSFAKVNGDFNITYPKSS